ncbi:MAG TPA: hypothetical protein VMF89_24850, partial [Polyangiales bacterium]|nr:hypothetical protein [Polyangiales bacterium]
ASALGQENVSIEQMVQEGQASGDDGVPVCLTTHITNEGSVRRALSLISSQKYLRTPPRLIRIEDV